MLKIVVTLLWVAGLMALTACAGPATAPSASVGPPADVAGTWTGSLVAPGVPVTMVLDQTGNTVKGDLKVGGRADVSGPVEGTVDGNTIKLRVASGIGSSPMLYVQGDRITGILAGTSLDLRRSR
jgi:hypothetical protein